MNTCGASNVPLLTDLNGRYDTNLNFEIESNAHACYSCGVMFKGDFYIYGSITDNKNEVSKVENCKLKRISHLGFSFRAGACTATPDYIFLCFPDGNARDCWRGSKPTNNFSKPTELSAHQHLRIKIANDNSKEF